MKTKHLLFLLMVVALITSCTVTPTAQAVLTLPTEGPTKTSTLVPTKTLTPEPPATATLTVMPSPTPLPLTELGMFEQNLFTDLGLNPIVGNEEFLCTNQGAAGVYLYSEDGEKLYISCIIKEGYEIDLNIKDFLIISIGYFETGSGSSLAIKMVGLKFSIYHGAVPEPCQGAYPEGGFFSECMFKYFGEYMTNWPKDENGAYWDPSIAYPISDNQAAFLRSKYSLPTYPEELKILGDGLPPKECLRYSEK